MVTYLNDKLTGQRCIPYIYFIFSVAGPVGQSGDRIHPYSINISINIKKM